MFKIPRALMNIIRPVYDQSPLTGTAYIANPSPELKTLEMGTRISVRMASTNTIINPTLKVNSLPAKPIVKGNDTSLYLRDILIGDIQPATWAEFIFDSILDKWVLLNPCTGVSSLAVGMGQTWQDVAASRALGTTYTNTTGRPIQVHVRVKTSTAAADLYAHFTLTIAGVVLGSPTTVSRGSVVTTAITAIIPPGATYVATGLSAVILDSWVELRT